MRVTMRYFVFVNAITTELHSVYSSYDTYKQYDLVTQKYINSDSSKLNRAL